MRKMISSFTHSIRSHLYSPPRASRNAHASTRRAFASREPPDPDDGRGRTGTERPKDRMHHAPLRIHKRSGDILNDPLFNKGTAFRHGERDRLRIRGLIPPRRTSMQVQIDRVMDALRDERSNIKKHLLLEDLHDRNETLYHRILVDHIEEVAPLVYTPTVGQACSEFASRYRRARGMYFSKWDRGDMAAMVYNWPHNDVHVIVVTDGSRILGLGDLGANGMGIPIGKLSLYCAAGGIAPHRVLPVVVDVGTDNETLLRDKYYLGIQEPRLTGDAYFAVLDEFMQAARHRWPNVLIQFEDFSSDVAQPLLDTYRRDSLVFNDDIQGTGATVLAGVLSALRVKGARPDALGDERILIAGAGSAGIGVAQVLLQAMVEQGWTPEEARRAFFIVDAKGLLGKVRGDALTNEQAAFAREVDDGLSLGDVVAKYRPTVLLGMTAVGGLFKESMLRQMARDCVRPIVFPLSNPTTKAECTAEQAFEWTDGRCVFASGSPFDPVVCGDGRVLYPTQCNNMYIFPGLGFGATLCGATRITDKMLYVAAEALADFVTEEDIELGKVFPHITAIRDVSKAIAVAVVKEAVGSRLATKLSEKDMDYLDSFVARKMYDPVYVPLVERREVLI